MTDKSDEVASRILKAVGDWKRGLITQDELRSMMFQAAAELEESQWRIIDDLRTRAPENESELASDVADALEAILREGSGSA